MFCLRQLLKRWTFLSRVLLTEPGSGMRDMFLCFSVLTYFLWQVTQGRKQLILTLREQIVNVRS